MSLNSSSSTAFISSSSCLVLSKDLTSFSSSFSIVSSSWERSFFSFSSILSISSSAFLPASSAASSFLIAFSAPSTLFPSSFPSPGIFSLDDSSTCLNFSISFFSNSIRGLTLARCILFSSFTFLIPSGMLCPGTFSGFWCCSVMLAPVLLPVFERKQYSNLLHHPHKQSVHCSGLSMQLPGELLLILLLHGL